MLCLVAAIGVYYYSSERTSGPVPERKFYYIDEATGAESVHYGTEVPPLLNADGNPTIVRVMYYSGDGGATKCVGYYEKFDEDGKNAYLAYLKNPHGGNAEQLERCMQNGRYLRAAAKDSPWVKADSPEANGIMNSIRTNGGPFSMVLPK